MLRVPGAPKPGETLTVEQVTRRAGGKGANQAVAAARAEAQVRIIGRVGKDPAGKRMLEDLRNEGVGIELVEVLPDVATGTAYVTVTPDGENTIVLDPGANARVGRDEVQRQADVFTSVSVMLAQLEVPVATVAAAVQLATRAGARPVVTLSPVQNVPSEMLHGLDPLLVNEHEAALLLDEDMVGGVEKAAERLLGLGPHSVVITLGAQGAVLAEAGRAVRVPAQPVEKVIDTTGAGDALAGALAAALARGAALDDAVNAGVAAAAVAVTRPGAR